MSRGLEATQIAESALDALQPVQLHAVKTESKTKTLNRSLNTTLQVNDPRNIATNLSPYEAASNLSFTLEKSNLSGFVNQADVARSNQINANANVLINLEEEKMNMDNGFIFEELAPVSVVHNMETSFKLQNEVSGSPIELKKSVTDLQLNEALTTLNTSRVDTSPPTLTQHIPYRKDVTNANDLSSEAENKINKKDVANNNSNNDFSGTKHISNTSSDFNNDFDVDFDDAFVSSDTTGGFEEMLA